MSITTYTTEYAPKGYTIARHGIFNWSWEADDFVCPRRFWTHEKARLDAVEHKHICQRIGDAILLPPQPLTPTHHQLGNSMKIIIASLTMLLSSCSCTHHHQPREHSVKLFGH